MSDLELQNRVDNLISPTRVKRSPPPDMCVTQDMNIMDCPASFDKTTQVGKAKMLNAFLAADYETRGKDYVEITCVDWCVIPGEKADDVTGEVSHFAWLVLFDKDGDMLKTTSQVVPHRLKRIFDSYTRAEWDEGITVAVVERRSASTKQLYQDLKVIPKKG